MHILCFSSVRVAIGVYLFKLFYNTIDGNNCDVYCGIAVSTEDSVSVDCLVRNVLCSSIINTFAC